MIREITDGERFGVVPDGVQPTFMWWLLKEECLSKMIPVTLLWIKVINRRWCSDHAALNQKPGGDVVRLHRSGDGLTGDHQTCNRSGCWCASCSARGGVRASCL